MSIAHIYFLVQFVHDIFITFDKKRVILTIKLGMDT